MEMPWLPRSRQGKVISPGTASHADALVSSLISHDAMWWREEEIDRLFLPTIAATIKASPLSLFNRDDLPFRPHT